MLVVSRQRQPLVILHAKKRQSVTLYQGEATDIPDFYAELPVFKRLVDAEIIATSGVAEKEREINKILDIPDDVKADLEKYKIPYSENTDKEFLIGRLKARKEEYQHIEENLRSGGVELKGDEDIDTLIELQNKLLSDESKVNDIGTKEEQKEAIKANNEAQKPKRRRRRKDSGVE